MNIRDELLDAIEALPCFLKPDTESCGVMRLWTHGLPRRHQGVLVAGIRGCDGAPKEDPSKSVSRMIRRAVLNPADERETLKSKGFFGFNAAEVHANLLDFLHSLDQYPLHYVMHLCHACEVIGYKHPDRKFRRFFEMVYRLTVHKFHLTPETEEAMDERLTCDRVAAGTTERDF